MFDDTRADWGAAPATNPVPMDLSKVTVFVNHWEGTGLPDLAEHTTCLSLVRSIQRYHQGTKGWSDIGYSGLVCPHGRKIEGRGDNVGAHTAGINDTAYGWCFLAGPEDPVTTLMYDTMSDARLACEDHIDRALTPKGHRDYNATDCPGDEAYAWVQAGMPSSGTNPLPPPHTHFELDQLRADLTGMQGQVEELRMAMTERAAVVDERLATLGRSLDSMSGRIEQIGSNMEAQVKAAVEEILGGVTVSFTLPRKESP